MHPPHGGADGVPWPRQTDRTSVTRLLGIAWRTVGRIVRRVGVARLDPDRYTGLTRIGVDECSYRKRHHYLTVVLNHDTGKVVWAAKGKNSEALCTFFDLIGPEQCASIHTVTIDMSAAYEKAVRERLPPATILFDRFHVQQLSTDAVEAVRRDSAAEVAECGRLRRGEGDQGHEIRTAEEPVESHPEGGPEAQRCSTQQRTALPGVPLAPDTGRRAGLPAAPAGAPGPR